MDNKVSSLCWNLDYEHWEQQLQQNAGAMLAGRIAIDMKSENLLSDSSHIVCYLCDISEYSILYGVRKSFINKDS